MLALITGASSGLGLEFAKIHAEKGGDLILVARSVGKMEALKTELESKYAVKVYVMPADLSDPAAPDKLFADVQSMGLQVDMLFNNAGFSVYGLFAETDWKKEEELLQVNMMALTRLTKLFVPGMVERRKGYILQVASNAAYQPGPTMALYYASKAFVYYFSSALYNELKPYGVHVTCLTPGPTHTGFQDRAEMHESRLLKILPVAKAEPVARYGYKALLKGKRMAIPSFSVLMLQMGSKYMPWNIVVPLTRYLQGHSDMK
ncbi:MAG TPA: SDR family oxidoreductase [Chitinophagales bacterium]|nr:SDR family oxidoreductase [Chitinophagales bacterium]